MTNKSIATINGNTLSRKNFLDAIDHEIIHLHDTGDVQQVMNVLNGLGALEDVSGHAKAKLLWASSEWYKQHIPDENFADHVTSTTNIRSKSTVDRYITVWRYVEDLTIPKQIAERPMRELVPIAKTLSQGYEISKEQWRKIDLCTNDGELRDILRKIKGKAERKSARVLKLARDGSLYLWKKNEKKFVGFLEVSSEDKDVLEIIEKIKISSGIVEE